MSVDLTAQTVGTAPADPILAVQQLVYTVTGALGTTDPVQVLVAGKQVTRLWGDGVDTSRPVARADPLGIRVLVGIDDPADGASVRSPVRIAIHAIAIAVSFEWFFVRLLQVQMPGGVFRQWLFGNPASLLRHPSFRGARSANPESN